MLKESINESKILNQFREITGVIYQNWWAERNGGNISVLLDESFVDSFKINNEFSKTKDLPFECPSLDGKFFLVTGSGKYYRNISKFNETACNAGIIQIFDNGKKIGVVWGFEEGSWPTSELPSHLLSHVERLKVNPNHTTVIHSHPTDIIALTFVEELDEKKFTFNMWKMISEASVVFPEGIGILEWMLPGSNEIGEQTAEKMKKYRSVIWAHHGIFCSGESLDEALGLLECIEKSAKIYLKILQTNKKILNEISVENMKDMSNFFGYELNEDILK
ncbi:rhamnulose-1-phosphate aldolase [Spiroplasma chinense]|uniref:Rhamnulose-1-phosphate aldolase n=1 Tax=Spiroplasma chinense TaxID=216932 RepID=A0A5B9Y4A1_9MOLU|nr:rhamnulose-1-phosphate aldolase [Spiroplasma chinense]QEH61998.1 rhamnulose-1-phosphate aldolase [Spiroplasma chinense]